MSKIYIVIADNGEAYEDNARWNVAAFTSNEAALEYIEKLPAEIRKHQERMDELVSFSKDWTADEKKEWQDLNAKWYRYHFFDNGDFYVEELEILN